MRGLLQLFRHSIDKGAILMSDVFIEYFVKAKRTARNRAVFILTILLAFLVPITLVVLSTYKFINGYFGMIAIFLFFFGIWAIWFVRSHQNVEYEYQVVIDTLVVSKVIAKRKRKELLRLDIRKIETMDTLKENPVEKLSLMRVYEAMADYGDKENTVIAVFPRAAGGRDALLFTPNEKILNGMKPYLKKDLLLKWFYHRKQNT